MPVVKFMQLKEKNAILSTVRGYSYEQIKPFIESLRKTGFKGDLILFVSKIGYFTKKKLEKQGVNLVPFSLAYPYLNSDGFADYRRYLPEKYAFDISLISARPIMYYLYLLKHGEKYSHVALTDARDVIFQKNPFEFKFKKGLSFFLEDKGRTIGACEVNSRWVSEVFGEKVLADIKDRPISCAGFVMGDYSSTLDYLKKMSGIITKSDFWHIIDQGVHNYLIHTNKLSNYTIFDNDNGPVFTMGTARNYILDKNDLFVNRKGEVFYVIHQYDRLPELARKYYSARVRAREKISQIQGKIAGSLLKYPKLFTVLRKFKNKL